MYNIHEDKQKRRQGLYVRYCVYFYYYIILYDESGVYRYQSNPYIVCILYTLVRVTIRRVIRT